MELVREPRSSQRRRHRAQESHDSHMTRNEQSLEARISAVVNDAEQEQGLTNLNTANELKGKLVEQEENFNTEKEKVKSKKSMYTERVHFLFDELRDALDKKEDELIGKIVYEFNGTEDYISGLIDGIVDDKNMLNDNDGNFCEIENAFKRRDEIYRQLKIPDFQLNEGSIEVVRNLEMGHLEDIASDNDDIEQSENERQRNERRNISMSSQNNRISQGRVSLVTNLQREEGHEQESDTPTPTNDPLVWSRHHDHRERIGHENVEGGDRNDQNDVRDREAPERYEAPSESEESAEVDQEEDSSCGREENSSSFNTEETRSRESVIDGAFGGVNQVPVPSAPPVEADEDPPPYWQAVGLECPESESPPSIPGYFDIEHSQSLLPNNKLEPWHSFPMKRQYDRRAPVLCALDWNGKKICVGDKANQKVKFFYPNGQLINEMRLPGNEIQDVSFLEECNGEARYIVAIPRIYCLCIIALTSDHQTCIVRKLQSSAFVYNTVSRGPKEQTLVGGFSGRVDLFNFEGYVFRHFSLTPSNVPLGYPKQVETFNEFIIVCDWKLRTVVVYKDSGEAVAEYRGTPSQSLHYPLDMTLDQYGNIIILDGEDKLLNYSACIHVIDLDCNPVEIIKIPRDFAGKMSPKLIAFNKESRRLCMSRSTGDVAVFTFQDGYDGLPQRRLGPVNLMFPSAQLQPQPRQPTTLPLVEGMLPSTIENIVTGPSRNRRGQFHL